MRRNPLGRLSGAVLSGLILSLLLVGALSLGTAQAHSPAGLGAQGPMMAASAASPNGLVINEVFDSATPANEYFELYNTSAVPINLSTYQIYNRDGNNSLSRLADPIIGPGQFRVIGPTQLGTPTIAGSGLERVDFLALVNTSPSDMVIDVINWGGAPNPNWPNYERFRTYFVTSEVPQLPALTTENPKSLQRWPDGTDNDRGSDFAQIFSSPGAPSCADPYEPDDTAAQASTQTIGATVLRRLCAGGDQDWISISMSTTFTYTLATGAQGSRVDTVLRLYDASGGLIVEDDNPSRRDSVINFRPSSQGTFRVQITDKNNAGAPGHDYLYTFTITTTSTNTPTPTTPTPTGCLDPYEPDDTLETARQIALNTEQAHALCPVGDQDWITFVAVADKVYTMYTKDLGTSVDTIIALFDADGNKLAENDDAQPGQGLHSRIDYTFGSAGSYYLRIRDRTGGGQGHTYTVGVSSTGQLPPTSTPTRSPTPDPNTPTATMGPCTDPYEPDGVPEAAKVILIGTTQRHSICPSTDADWLRFYAVAGKVYTVRTHNLGPGLDTFMFIFDTNASRILAQNDDGGEGVASKIDFFPLRDGWYYAQIKNQGDIGGSQQTYDLSLSVAPGAAQPPPTATGITQPPPATPRPANTPTTVVQPTPTRAGVPPTPTVPLPVPTTQQIPPPPQGTAVVGLPTPTSPPAPPPQPTATVVEPTPMVPGVPVTGRKPDSEPETKRTSPAAPAKQPAAGSGKPQEAQAAPASKPPPPKSFAPMLFRLYYDRNGNDKFDKGEGVRGVEVYFLGGDDAPASARTSEEGACRASVPVSSQRLYIPYLGINMPLKHFPEREAHSIWLAPVELPDRVP